MSIESAQPPSTPSPEVSAARSLYQQLLACWNRRDSVAYAALFTADAACIGFDGSELIGQAEIATSLRDIFANHVTPQYVGKVRTVRLLRADVGILRAVVGMIPPGQSRLDPHLHAVQTLVATRHDGQWRIDLFQNTPAQFHGRPEAVEQLTTELQQLL